VYIAPNSWNDEAFKWFLMGRHSGSVQFQGEIDPAKKQQEMQPFLKHELRRVREWADYEIRLSEQNAKLFQEWDEEDERR